MPQELPPCLLSHRTQIELQRWVSYRDFLICRNLHKACPRLNSYKNADSSKNFNTWITSDPFQDLKYSRDFLFPWFERYDCYFNFSQCQLTDFPTIIFSFSPHLFFIKIFCFLLTTKITTKQRKIQLKCFLFWFHFQKFLLPVKHVAFSYSS